MRQISFISEWQIILVFLFTFLGDTLTALWFSTSFNFSWIFKSVLALLMVFNLFYFNPDVLKHIFVAYGLIAIGMFINYQGDIVSKTSLFFEYYSGILIIWFLIKNRAPNLIDKILFYVFLFYIITILMAVIFKIEYFKTYANSERFGYMPLFNSQNEFSFIMIAIVAFFYKKLSVTKKTINYLLFSLSIISACLVGTKIIYLFVFILINFIIFKGFGAKIYLIGGSLFLILNFFFKDLWYSLLKNNFNTLIIVYEKNGFIDAVSSLRLSNLGYKMECQLSGFNLVNYFFGGSNLDCVVEMSILDLFLFFGIIGFLYYFYLNKKFLLSNLKLDSFGYLLIISVTLLSFLGGYYFENFSAQLYLVSITYLFYFQDKNSSQKKALVK